MGRHMAKADKNDQFHAPTSRLRFSRFRDDMRSMMRKQPVAPANDGEQQHELAGEQNFFEKHKLRKDKATRRRYLKRFWHWLKPFRGQLLMLVISGLALSTLDVVMPLCTKVMIDIIAPSDEWQQHLPIDLGLDKVGYLWALGGFALAVMLISNLIGLWRNLSMRTLTQISTNRLRRQLYDHILRLPLADLHALKSGGVISRCSSDVDHTVGLIQQGVLSPVMAVIRLLVVTVTLFMLSWQVTLVALGLLGCMATIHQHHLKRVRPIYRSMGQDRQRIDGRVAETFGGLRVVRSFGRESHETLGYMLGHHTALRKVLWATGIQQVLHVFWELLMPLTSLAIVGLGCYLALEGGVTAGDIVAIQMLTFQVLHPVHMIVRSMTETQRSLAAMERVYEVLDRAHDKQDRREALPAPARVDELSFQHVDFAYGHENHSGGPLDIADDRLVLRDVSVTVPGGTVLALVGSSGAGKTTFTDLVARFHDPSRGCLTLNGVDLRDYRLDGFRSLLGIVQQETVLFDDTVGNNIGYPRRDADPAAIREAARRANALGFIEELPNGFDTVVGERGVRLSGGQRQRIAIARALLADPQILILDEATSNLDSESEQLIQEALQELLRGRTTIIVAHRLSTIQHADQILVLEKGEVIQRGSHAELMARGEGSPYHDMVERQRLDMAIAD